MSSHQTQRNTFLDLDRKPEDFLSPEQRLDAVAEILAIIGLRAMKESGDTVLDENDPV